ncbi:MAG: hypothetical protein AAFP76_15715 [Bacteroidota bacterium]
MKNPLFPLFLASFFLISISLKAQNCSEGLTLINELWQNFDPMDLVNNKDGLKQQTDKLKNELVSFTKLSLKKDAPRILPVGSGEKKINLKPNKKRVFVTTPIKQETVTLTISRPENGSKATVTICTHTLKGESRNLEKVKIVNQGPQIVEIPLSDIKGRILSINVTNTGGSKIQYRINAR